MLFSKIRVWGDQFDLIWFDLFLFHFFHIWFKLFCGSLRNLRLESFVKSASVSYWKLQYFKFQVEIYKNFALFNEILAGKLFKHSNHSINRLKPKAPQITSNLIVYFPQKITRNKKIKFWSLMDSAKLLKFLCFPCRLSEIVN